VVLKRGIRAGSPGDKIGTLKGGITEHEQDYPFRNPGMKSGTGGEVHQGLKSAPVRQKRENYSFVIMTFE
jgi:hypothetical protein